MTTPLNRTRTGTGPPVPANAIERPHLEFKRRIKTQTVLPSAETPAMLSCALLASGQVVLRKATAGRRSHSSSPSPIHGTLRTEAREP